LGKKGDLTRQRLIKTAKKLFHSQGYINTSISEVCRLSGVNRGNLYFHFQNKQDLAIAVLEHALATEMPFLENLMSSEPDPLRRLELMLNGIISYNVDRKGKGGCLFGNFALEMGDNNREISAGSARFFQVWRDLIAGLLQEAKAKGRLRPDFECQETAQLIMCTMEGALVICKASKDTGQLQRTGDTLIRLILDQQIPASVN
jgi:AcrR family transcriptional regulator